jgi:HTH-type transcriptional regulator/antitoxin MqsA
MTQKHICGQCGGQCLTPFASETLTVGGGQAVAGLSGMRCADCGEVYLDAASQARFAQAGNALVLARRAAQQKDLARIRRKLRLTQHQAAQLTGGGHNAFGRYERGEARPLPAVMNLFRILDAHPELLHEIQK